MKRLLLFIFFASCILGTLFSQSTVKEMKAQVGELQSAIKQKEKILLSSEKDVKSKLQNLQLLTAQMGERKSYINALLSEIKSLERHRLKIIAEIQEME